MPYLDRQGNFYYKQKSFDKMDIFEAHLWYLQGWFWAPNLMYYCVNVGKINRKYSHSNMCVFKALHRVMFAWMCALVRTFRCSPALSHTNRQLLYPENIWHTHLRPTNHVGQWSKDNPHERTIRKRKEKRRELGRSCTALTQQTLLTESHLSAGGEETLEWIN